MIVKKVVVSLLISCILAVFASTSFAQTDTCYTVNINISNSSNVVVSTVDVTLSKGNPFLGTLMLGPKIATVGPIPANGSQLFTGLQGTWDQVPDNVVISSSNNQGQVNYTATISAGCPEPAVSDSSSTQVVIPQSQLPGVPLDTSQGFVLAPAGTDSNLEIWVIDDNGNGVQGVVLTADELSALPTSPTTNTEIASGSGFGFYVLTTGEYQINYGPTADGWVDEIIFNRDFEVVRQSRFSIIPR